MSFRFYQPDEPEPVDVPAELPAALPPELAALGEQLQADAHRLGNVYPACRAPLDLGATKGISAQKQDTERRDFNRNLIIAVSAAAALLFIAACIQLTWLPPSNTAASDPAAVATEVTPDQIAGLATVSSLQGTVPTVPALQPVSYHPAVGEMNGPELEGLLDLLDDQPHAAAVISF